MVIPHAIRIFRAFLCLVSGIVFKTQGSRVISRPEPRSMIERALYNNNSIYECPPPMLPYPAKLGLGGGHRD